MSIQIGDAIPHVTLKQVTAKGVLNVNTSSLFQGKTVVLFGIPAAFSSTCTQTHMPSFSKKMDTLKAQGIEVMCTAVNDPFVLGAWARHTQAHPEIVLLSDWNAEFAKTLGLTMDGSDAGLGTRSARYSMIVENGIVTHLNLEPNSVECTVSSGDAIFPNL